MELADSTVPHNSVIDILRARVTQGPDTLAVNVVGRGLSCAELADQVERCAVGLASCGVAKGDRVATMLFNCVEQIVVWFAAARIGAVWVPLNVGLMGDDLAYTLNDAAPRVLVTDSDCADKLDTIRGRVDPALQCFLVAETPRSGYGAFSTLPRAGSAPEVTLARHDEAAIIYTGGTTGMPKGVVLPHFAWVAAACRYVQAFEVGPGDSHYSVLPLFHVGGSMIGFLGPFLAGIPTHFDRWFSVKDFWRRVRETGATIIDPIGTMVSLLCQAPAGPADRDHRVRLTLAVLSQVPKQFADEFPKRFGIGLVNVYSLSESGGTLIVRNRPDSPKLMSNGKPWGWCDIRIGGEGDRPLAPGKIGEILLRPVVPDTFMLRYHNNPDKTLETFRNLWLHTGDLGYLDDEGYLFFTGRHAHWMRCRGENVSAYEVEGIISRYPGVREVIAVGVPAPLGDEDIKAFIIAEPGAIIEPRGLVLWCRDRMAAFKLPRYVVFLEEFPRSTTKREVERHKLKALAGLEVWDAEQAFGGRGYRASAAKR